MSTQPEFFYDLALGNDSAGNLYLVCTNFDNRVYLAATQPAGDDEWTVAKTNALDFQPHHLLGLALGTGRDRKLQVVGLGSDDGDRRLYLAAYFDTDNAWKLPPGSLSGPLGDPNRQYTSFAVVNGFLGNLCVIALADDHQLYAPVYQDITGAWLPSPTPGALGDTSKNYTAFAVARGYGGSLQLLALDDEQRLYLVAQQNDTTGVWTAPASGLNPVGGLDPRYIALAAARGYDGNLRVVALGRGGNVYAAAYQDDTDGSWHAMSQPLGNPTAVYTSLTMMPAPRNTRQVVCLGTDGAAYIAVYLDADGHWHAGDATFNPLGGRGDRQYSKLAFGTGYAGSLQVVALESQPTLGGPYLAAYLDTNETWQPGRSLAQGRPTRWHPRVYDAKAVFDAIPAQGVVQEFRGAPQFIIEPVTHIQGMARYGSYYILTHDSLIASTGDILLYSNARGEYLNSFSTAISGYRHPGGCQVIGDYLVVPIEDDDSSYITFYYLGALDANTEPRLLSTQIRRRTSKAGAAGITDVGNGAGRHYVVAVYDSPKVTIYASNEHPLDDTHCVFTELFTSTPEGHGADNLCMFTDMNNQVYILALTSTGDHRPDTDWAQLYLVDFQNRRFVTQEVRKMGTTGHPHPRFRWGAGLTIASSASLELYCTNRQVYDLRTNTFGA